MTHGPQRFSFFDSREITLARWLEETKDGEWSDAFAQVFADLEAHKTRVDKKFDSANGEYEQLISISDELSCIEALESLAIVEYERAETAESEQPSLPDIINDLKERGKEPDWSKLLSSASAHSSPAGAADPDPADAFMAAARAITANSAAQAPVPALLLASNSQAAGVVDSADVFRAAAREAKAAPASSLSLSPSDSSQVSKSAFRTMKRVYQ